MFPYFRREPWFHLFKCLFQKGLVDKRITEISLKIIQSCEDPWDIFSVRLGVDCFIAQMCQTLRSTVGDQFLDGRLPKETNTKRAVEYSTGNESESPSPGADNQVISSSTGLKYVRLRKVSRRVNLMCTGRRTCQRVVRKRVIPEHIKCTLHTVRIRTRNQ